MKLIYNYIDKINYRLGLLLFNNSNLLSYNIFRELYKKKICNLKTLDNDLISSYYKNGYSRLGTANLDQIKELKILLDKQNPQDNNESLFHYKVTPEIFRILKNILEIDLVEKIKILEKYYNHKILLTFLTIARNYSSSKKSELYSNYFHTDGYTYNMFKVFVNLHDVNEENGPLTLVKKEHAKEFIKEFNYKNRNSYEGSNHNGEMFYKNIGKMGDVFLCSTSELFHRAGDPKPGHYRDMIFFNFVAYPSKEKNISILKHEKELFDDKLIRRLSKIRGLKNLITFYKKNMNEKLI